MKKSMIDKPYYWLLGATALILIHFFINGINYSIIPGYHVSGEALFLYPAVVTLPITASLYLIAKLNKMPLNIALTIIHVVFSTLPIAIYLAPRIRNMDMEFLNFFSDLLWTILFWAENLGILLFVVGQIIFLINFIIALFRKTLAIEK